MTELLSPHVEIESLGGRTKRATIHIAPIAYQDENGALQRIVPDWTDGDAAYPHIVTASRLAVSVGADGFRKIHPTRESAVYAEIGAPYIKPGTSWQQVSLGVAERNGSLLTWTTANANVYVRHAGHYVKLGILLKNGWVPPGGQFAFPVGLTGLTRTGNTLYRNGMPVMWLRPFHVEDMDNPDDWRPVAHQFTVVGGQAYILCTLPDLSGMSRPLIDPTFDSGTTGAGKDTYLLSSNSDKHFGGDNILGVDAAVRHGLLYWDLAAIPADATCDSATLTLTNNAQYTTNRTQYLYDVAAANDGWPCGSTTDPGTGKATWDNHTEATQAWAGSAGCSTAGTDYVNSVIGTLAYQANDPVGTEVAAALTTAVVQGWFGNTANYGLFLKGGDFAVWNASEHATAAYRPKLVIVYTEAGGTDYPQAAAGAQTNTGTIGRNVGKPLTGNI